MKKLTLKIVRRTGGRDTVGYGGNPKAMLGQFWGAQLNPLGQTYDALRDSIYQALLPQTRLKPYLDAVNFADGSVADAMRMLLDRGRVASLRQAMAHQEVDGVSMLNDFVGRFAGNDANGRLAA
jgi:hypothetical protein